MINISVQVIKTNTKWEKLILPGSFDNVFETNDFDGAILFEKSFSFKRS